MEQIGGGTARGFKKADISVDWICLDDTEETPKLDLKKALTQAKLDGRTTPTKTERLMAENESLKKKVDTLTADNEELSKDNYWHEFFIPDNMAQAAENKSLKAKVMSQKKSIATLTANNTALAKENTSYKVRVIHHFRLTLLTLSELCEGN